MPSHGPRAAQQSRSARSGFLQHYPHSSLFLFHYLPRTTNTHTHNTRICLLAAPLKKSQRNIPPMPCCLHILNLSRPLGHPHYPLPLRFLVHTARRSPHTQPPQICALALGHPRRHASLHSYAAPRCPLAARPAPAPRVAWWFGKRRFHPQRKNEKEFG
jgi:hypothetical protein